MKTAKRIIAVLLALTMLFGTTATAIAAGKINVTGVDITSSTMNLFIGQFLHLNAKVYPADATDKTVIWTSADENIASVRYDGRVYGMGTGTTTITATTNDGRFTDTCVVTVSDVYVTSLEITRLPYKTVYKVGETHTNEGLLLEVVFSNGEVKTLNCSYSWFPPDMDTPGQKEVEVRYGGKRVYYYITVEGENTPVEPDEPEKPAYKNATSVDIIVDRNFNGSTTAQLSAKINPSNAEYSKIDWYSSDTCVASVNSNGLVTLGSCNGTATITVKVTNKDGSTVTNTITVENNSNTEVPDTEGPGTDDPEGETPAPEADGGIFGSIINLFASMIALFMTFFSLIFAFV